MHVSIYKMLYIVIITFSILTPLQAVGILIWYIVREIIDNEEEKWYRYSRASLIMVLTQVEILNEHTCTYIYVYTHSL